MKTDFNINPPFPSPKAPVVAKDKKVAIPKLAGNVHSSHQPIERRRGLLARALRGTKSPATQLPEPQEEAQ